MDPDTAWNELRRAIRDNDVDAASEYAAALLDWLDGGGFPPSDLDGEEWVATDACCAVRRVCLAVLADQAAGGGR